MRTADGGSASHGAGSGSGGAAPSARMALISSYAHRAITSIFQRDVACQAIGIRSYASVAAIEDGDEARRVALMREDQRMNGASRNTKLAVAATPVSPITRMT